MKSKQFNQFAHALASSRPLSTADPIIRPIYDRAMVQWLKDSAAIADVLRKYGSLECQFDQARWDKAIRSIPVRLAVWERWKGQDWRKVNIIHPD